MAIAEGPAQSAWAQQLQATMRRLRAAQRDPETRRAPTIRQIAQRSGYSVGHVQAILHGQGRPRPEAVEAVAGALNASAQDLQTLRDVLSHWDDILANRSFRLVRFSAASKSKSGWLSTVDPRSRFGPFLGRDKRLADLATWRDSAVPIAVRLIYGQPGMGKTRLMAEFALDTRTAGWTVLEAIDDGRPTAPHRFGASASVLVLIDDIGAVPGWEIVELIRAVRTRSVSSVRILFTARSAGHDWQVLRRRIGIGDVTTTALGPLEPAADLTSRFIAALQGRSAVADPVAVPLSAEPLEPLAALLAAISAVGGDADRRSVSADLVNRERDHWGRTHTHDRAAARPTTMDTVMLLANLLGPLPYERAAALFSRLGIDAAVLDAWATRHPAADGVLAPLGPPALRDDYLAAIPEQGLPQLLRLVRRLTSGEFGADLAELAAARRASASAQEPPAQTRGNHD